MSEITSEELNEKIGASGAERDFVLIDVREPSEFFRGNIEGAILIPLGELEEKIASLVFSPESEIIVYCQTGRRSAAAAGILEKIGYKNVKNLSGGIMEYFA